MLTKPTIRAPVNDNSPPSEWLRTNFFHSLMLPSYFLYFYVTNAVTHQNVIRL